MGADSVVITRKQVSVVIPFNAISRIACGSDTHGVANAGQKFAATMLLALQSKTGKAPVEDDIGVRLALESKSGRLPTEATHPPTAGDALVKQVAQPTDSTADSDNAIRNQAPLNAKTHRQRMSQGKLLVHQWHLIRNRRLRLHRGTLKVRMQYKIHHQSAPKAPIGVTTRAAKLSVCGITEEPF